MTITVRKASRSRNCWFKPKQISQSINCDFKNILITHACMKYMLANICNSIVPCSSNCLPNCELPANNHSTLPLTLTKRVSFQPIKATPLLSVGVMTLYVQLSITAFGFCYMRRNSFDAVTCLVDFTVARCFV